VVYLTWSQVNILHENIIQREYQRKIWEATNNSIQSYKIVHNLEKKQFAVKFFVSFIKVIFKYSSVQDIWRHLPLHNEGNKELLSPGAAGEEGSRALQRIAQICILTRWLVYILTIEEHLSGLLYLFIYLCIHILGLRSNTSYMTSNRLTVLHYSIMSMIFFFFTMGIHSHHSTHLIFVLKRSKCHCIESLQNVRMLDYFRVGKK
jgi:hypothetical protein